MEGLKPPKPLKLDDSNMNIGETWTVWKQEFAFYMYATEASAKGDRVKSSILLTCIGPKARKYIKLSYLQHQPMQ